MATFRERFQRRRWERRLTIGSAVALASFALFGFFVAPPVARHLAERQLGELLGRNVTIARVRINPFALSLTVEGFEILETDRKTPFVGFRRLYVNAQLSSLYRRAPVIKEISLDGLRIRVARLKATPDAWADTGAYNFSDILARLAARPAAPPPPPDPNASAPRFSLNNMRLTDGAVTFEDHPLGSRHQITDLAVGVPFVSTLPVYLDSFVEPGLSVRVDGTPFAVAGRTKPFKDSLETLLELRLDALDLTKYVAFVPLRLPFLVESARLTVALDLSFVRPRVDAPTLTLKGRVALHALDLREKRAGGSTPLARLDKLEIAVGDSDVTAQRFQVSSILLSGLDLRVRRSSDGTLNLQHLAPTMPGPASRARPAPKSTGAAPPSTATAPVKATGAPRVSVGTFTLEKAAVRFRDESVSPVFESDVRDVAVSVHGLSNAPGASARVKVALRAAPGGTLVQEGTLRLTPLSAGGTIAIEGIEPARFAPYMHDLVAFDILKGRLRLGTRYLYEEGGATSTVRLSDALIELSDLALRRRGAHEDFFRVGEFAVRGAKLDLGQRTVTVASLSTRDGRVQAARDPQGVIDLSTLVSAPPVAGAPPPVPVPRVPPKVAATPAPAWAVSLARMDIEEWGARFEDRAVSPTAVLTVNPLTVHVTQLSTVPGTRFGIDLRLGINKTGRLTLMGTAGIDPVAANLRFDLRALEILPFQPYFGDQVGLTLTSGTVAAKGKLGLAMKARKGANPDPQVDVDADLGVADLATVDRDKHEPLVKWRSFTLAGLRMSNHPLAVAIKEVALNDLDAHLVLFPDGRFNLQEGLTAPGAPPQHGNAAGSANSDRHKKVAPPPAKVAPPPANPPNASPPRVTIDAFTLRGGKVVYTDRVIQPRYAAEVTELGGRIAGLSSTAGSIADVDLHAVVNRSGSLTIKGKTNPLAKDLFLDVQVAVKDLELPPASPYAGKFAGYGISKGKLDLALDYKIANRKLDAKNKLVLDQFTFGDKVDSPDAVKAPVRLAVALLKDRHGVIDIDLPISGSLDDPKFKVWPAILKVLVNLMVKAATAPFSLIAAAFGGGDELSRIDFPAGGSDVDADAQRKVGSLAKALLERPGLSLEIEGIADPKPDREGLRRFVFERKLKAQKLIELVQAGAAVSSPDLVQLDAVERPRLLTKAYQAEKFPKPKNVFGLEKTLPVDEMQKLILTNTRVEDDDLRALALRRATALQASLVKHAPGASSRLFLVTPRVAAGGGHVEIRLKKD